MSADRQREIARAVAAEQYWAIFDCAGLGLVAVDLGDSTFLHTNRVFQELLGYSGDELLGARFADYTHPDDHERDEAHWSLQQHRGDPVRFEKRYIRKDGTAVWVDLAATLLPATSRRPAIAVAVIRNVTAQREAEEALQLNERRLTLALEGAAMASWELDFTTDRFTWLGDLPARLFGVDAVPRTSDEYFERVEPEDRALLHRALEERVAGGLGETEFRIRAADGQMRWLASRATIVRDPLGEPSRMIGVWFDVTERKEAEERLRSANVLLESIISASPLAIVATDLDDRVTIWNRSAEQLFGWSAEEIIGEELPFLSPEESARRASIQERVRAGEIVLNLEKSLLRKDGTRVEVNTFLAARLDEDGQMIGIVGILADVGEQQRAKRELERSVELLERADGERRRLLAQVVGAQEEERRRIAVDIHDDTLQAMTAVGLRLALLRRADVEPEQAELLGALERSVVDAMGRLRRLVFELRPPELDRGGLASAIRTILEQGHSEFGLEYRLENGLTDEPSLDVRTIAYRIAREALANVRKHARASSTEVKLKSVGEGFLVSVGDDGIGFTLDEVDRGRGGGHLGLIEMRERAELAGGWLRIDSRPGAGTKVAFWLPAELGGSRDGQPALTEPGWTS